MSWKNMASPKTKCLVSSKKNFHWLYWKIALAQGGVKRSQEREHTGRRCVQTFATGWHWRCPGLLLTIFFLLLSHGSEGLTKALEAQSSHKNVTPSDTAAATEGWCFAVPSFSPYHEWVYGETPPPYWTEEKNKDLRRKRDQKGSLRGNLTYLT